MKQMMKVIAKMAAKFALRYLPDVAVWAIRQGAGAAKGNVKAATVLCVMKHITTDAAMIARIMADGAVTEAEAAEARARAEALVEEMQGLL